MFDTIFIGTSGLLGHAKGLRIVGNNLSGVNTPGFKGSQLNFGSVFSTNAQDNVKDSVSYSIGQGLTTLGSTINFKNGEKQNTNFSTNAFIEGDGFFTIKRGDNNIAYTRLGDFTFNTDDILINSNGDRVQSLDSKGNLVDIDMKKFNSAPGEATSQFNIEGSLKKTETGTTEKKIENAELFDSEGKKHLFDIEFKEKSDGMFGITFKAKDAEASFIPATTEVALSAFSPPNRTQITTSFFPPKSKPSISLIISINSLRANSNESAVEIRNRNGREAGTRTGQTLKEDGNFEITYSNGQKLAGPSLAMAKFNSVQDLEQIENSAFSLKDGRKVDYGLAGSSGIGKLINSNIEASNVNLVEEFGKLILMQRGYQASSHVISTSNEMIQQLFDMKGNR